MNEKIGVIIDFLTPAYENTLRDTAARCGYDIVFFPSSKAAEGNVDDCTILYGHPSQHRKALLERLAHKGREAAVQVAPADGGKIGRDDLSRSR